MKRREWLQRSAAFGFVAGLPLSTALGARSAASGTDKMTPQAAPNPLTPPKDGRIPVAFVVSEGAVVIDFCGPWEVFQDVMIPGGSSHPFHLYTVAETTRPIEASGGMKIIPDYTFETAPAPKVIVIPAQSGRSEAMLEWIRKAARSADVTMSVCTGAFLLARTGLLKGRSATTHHTGYQSLAVEFPDIAVKRGVRFVEDGNLATSGGLSCGIDLAFRVVERYYGREAATQTAYEMEYQGEGWVNSDSNAVYATVQTSTDAHPRCPVCSMEVDPKTAPKASFKGKTYYFCSQEHETQFNATPDKFLTETH
jgi:putative intracellular protease/amidase/YHS domain-containing protein